MLEQYESFTFSELTSDQGEIPDDEFRRYLREAGERGKLVFANVEGVELILKAKRPA